MSLSKRSVAVMTDESPDSSLLDESSKKLKYAEAHIS